MTHWASHAVTALLRGESCDITPHGNSMQPRIHSGATVTLTPLGSADPKVGDVVLAKVRGTVYLHLVGAVRGLGDDRQYQITNNRGAINGWARRSSVYGLATKIG
jgi:hypothetical protein